MVGACFYSLLGRKLYMKTHILKILPNFFEDIVSGKKTFECRYNDRGYQIGDCLYLKEYDIESNQYSGREMLAPQVIYNNQYYPLIVN